MENIKSLGTVCPCCGRKGFNLSSIKFAGGYGSKYDMESVMLPLCGDCFDGIYERAIESVGRSLIEEDKFDEYFVAVSEMCLEGISGK